MKRHAARTSGKITNLALHMILVIAASAGSYFWLSQQAVKQQQLQVTQLGQQAATLVERHAANWLAQTQLLAQQPDLQSPATLKAVIPAEGSVPPSLSFALQDLLNRTRQAPTAPEFDLSGAKPMVDVATSMPIGGYLVAQWPFEPLAKDLQQITPNGYQLRLLQKVSGSPVDTLRINSNGNDGQLKAIALSLPQWELQVGSTDTSSMLPLWAALISLLGGVLALVPWLLSRQQPAVQQALPAVVPISASPTPNSIAAAAPPTEPSMPPAEAEPTVSLTKPTEPEPVVAAHEDESSQLEDDIAPPPASANPSNSLEFELDDLTLSDLELTIAPAAQFPYHLFRAYDVRGTINELNESLIERVGQGLGSVLRDRLQHQVVVGYDARLTSPRYAELVRNALVKSGLTVIDIGQVPTPIMHFAAKQHDGNGIMITASHCAGDQNGVKWVIENAPPKPEDIQALAERVEQKKFVEGVGQVRQYSYTDEYIDNLQSDVILGQSFDIALDGMNGMMGEIAEKVLRAAGCQVSGINLVPNGQFPNGDPDPSKMGQLDDLCNDVIISNADLGFAFDGDGDRLVVVDRQGQMVSPDQLIALYAQMVLTANPGADIVFDVKCSRLLNTVITEGGGRPVMVRSGNTFIRQALQSDQYDAAFGAEFSGHYFFNDGRSNNNDDGLYAALRLLEWLDQQGQSLSEMLKSLPPRVGTHDIYVPLDGADARQLMADLQMSAEQLPEGQLTLLDGIRLDFKDGFGIIRPSNTGPYLTARFDGETPEALARIRQLFQDLVSQHHPTLAKHLID
ncbi:MAG: hypothetical protein VXW65_06235 [Pseudomonadota bacterium]|nr:hypothetical protein [Pseudomonadota bacterium]